MVSLWGDGYMTFHLGLAVMRLMQLIAGSCIAAMLKVLGLRLCKKCCYTMDDFFRFCCHILIQVGAGGVVTSKGVLFIGDEW